ncbi:MAG: helix-turn-helix transcriptional regulator [Vampirovibrionales bacterium]|nr:helix-turn-helix transcriptional regulator [Vampirovibrionales bacterium]
MLRRLRVAEAARQYKGWTMRQLAEHLFVAHQTVMYWNQGRVFPRLTKAVEICETLGCSLDDLTESRPSEGLEDDDFFNDD